MTLAVGDVVVGAGLLRHVGARCAAAVPGAHRWAVCIDATVDGHHGSTVRASFAEAPSWHVVPSGERHKTRDTWGRLTDALLAAGHGRDSAVCAVGGGVTGDIAGFVAATYLRGIPVVQVPTTLLAMVDASIGGKTGLDVPAGKNLVGAFHPPAAVVVDPTVLATLSPAERRAGFAEMLKHGVVADASHFLALADAAPALLADGAAADLLADAIAASVRIKAGIVAADPTEQGQRAVLNFGHTLAHAVEQVTGYAVRHGEAVAMGMVIEARVGEQLGVTPRGVADTIAAALRRAGLPYEVPADLPADDLLAAMRLDKKARQATVRCALPAALGTMARDDDRWTIAVPDTAWRDALRR